MSKSFIPQGYRSKLGLYDTQNAIEIIKSTFLESLSAVLRLKRVSAPLFVNPAEGLNDNLNGVERPVSFDIPATGGHGGDLGNGAGDVGGIGGAARAGFGAHPRDQFGVSGGALRLDPGWTARNMPTSSSGCPVTS